MIQALIGDGFLSYNDLTFIDAQEMAVITGLSEELADEVVMYAEEYSDTMERSVDQERRDMADAQAAAQAEMEAQAQAAIDADNAAAEAEAAAAAEANPEANPEAVSLSVDEITENAPADEDEPVTIDETPTAETKGSPV